MGEISCLASQNRQQGNQLFLSLDNKVYTKRAADIRLAFAYSRVCALYLLSVGIRRKPEIQQPKESWRFILQYHQASSNRPQRPRSGASQAQSWTSLEGRTSSTRCPLERRVA